MKGKERGKGPAGSRGKGLQVGAVPEHNFVTTRIGKFLYALFN